MTIEQNDFAPSKGEERLLFMTSEGCSVELRPDNPMAGAVAYLCLHSIAEDTTCDASLTPEEARAIRDALTILLEEGGS